MTAFVTVDCTVYPYECEVFGHLNEAASLARGPVVCIDRSGRSTLIPDEVRRLLGPRLPPPPGP